MQGAVQFGYEELEVRVVGLVSVPPAAHCSTTNCAPPTPAVPLPPVSTPPVGDNRMRKAMGDLNKDLLLKIGIHEGPCLAVMLNERQDYFGQTVNIASRVQNLADASAIFATGQVVGNSEASRLLKTGGIVPTARSHVIRGIANQVTVYEIR